MNDTLSAAGWNDEDRPASGRAAAGAPDAALLPGRDLFEVARYLAPMEARLAQGCLQASGIPAVLADDQLVQANMLWAPALGGVRVLVPQDYLQQAEATLDAMRRGAFALDDDADVGGS